MLLRGSSIVVVTHAPEAGSRSSTADSESGNTEGKIAELQKCPSGAEPLALHVTQRAVSGYSPVLATTLRIAYRSIRSAASLRRTNVCWLMSTLATALPVGGARSNMPSMSHNSLARRIDRRCRRRLTL